MNFCLARSEHTWLWPGEEGGFDGSLQSHSRAIDLGLPPLAQSAVLLHSFFSFFLAWLLFFFLISKHFEFFHR